MCHTYYHKKYGLNHNIYKSYAEYKSHKTCLASVQAIYNIHTYLHIS